MQGPAAGPEGTGPAGLLSPFQPLDPSYSVTVPGHLATQLTDRKADPGSSVLAGAAVPPPSPTAASPLESVALPFHKPQVPTLSELGCICTEAVPVRAHQAWDGAPWLAGI